MFGSCVILSMLLRGVAFLRKDLFCLLCVLEWGPPLVYSFWAVDPMGPTWVGRWCIPRLWGCLVDDGPLFRRGNGWYWTGGIFWARMEWGPFHQRSGLDDQGWPSYWMGRIFQSGCVGPINRHPLSSIGGPRRHPLVPVCLRNIICSCRSWTEKWLIDVWHIERWMARIFGIKALMSSIIESRSLEARTEKSLFETRGTLQCSCFYWKEASFSVFRVSSNFKLVPP